MSGPSPTPSPASSCFDQWREAQARLAQAEQALAMAQAPGVVAEAARMEQLVRDVRELGALADQLLQQCLRETQRQKRVSRQLGLDSGGDTLP
jgi:hypothetical protein